MYTLCRLAKLEPGSLLLLVCAPPLVGRAVPGQVAGTERRELLDQKIKKRKKQQAASNKLDKGYGIL